MDWKRSNNYRTHILFYRVHKFDKMKNTARPLFLYIDYRRQCNGGQTKQGVFIISAKVLWEARRSNMGFPPPNAPSATAPMTSSALDVRHTKSPHATRWINPTPNTMYQLWGGTQGFREDRRFNVFFREMLVAGYRGFLSVSFWNCCGANIECIYLGWMIWFKIMFKFYGS